MSAKVKSNYQLLRSRLILKGTNLRRWASQRGYPLTTVYDAAMGRRAGIKAIQIKTELEAFANE